MKERNDIVVFIIGPTAIGKSRIAIKIAERFNGEIINTDSMQIYRNMNIGTAAPSQNEQKKIKHHLINILDIHEKIDVFKYKKLAENALCEIRKRGKIAIFAGGSGLYIKTLLDDIEEPPASPELARKLKEEYSGENAIEKLANFLKDNDPNACKKTYPNMRRMLRAAEIILLKQSSPSSSTTPTEKKILSHIKKLVFSLKIEKELLKKNIIARTDQMLQNGWIDEAKMLIINGLLNTPTARQAIGYAIIAKFLSGEISYEEMREKIISQTLKLAKKQITWFKNQHKNTIPINLPDEENKIFDIILKEKF